MKTSAQTTKINKCIYDWR